MTYDPLPFLLADFERSRKEMLLTFRMLVCLAPELVAQEAEATLSAMRQLFQLETAQ